MRSFTASRARTVFYSILDDVETGETISITRNGKPIARVQPIAVSEIAIDPEQVQRGIEGTSALRKRIGKLSIEEILAARDEGRE